MLNSIAAVFTLLTISIGEEFEFKFFKVLACVSGDPVHEGRSKLTAAGLDGDMCRDVACCDDEDNAACRQRQDVFRTVFGNRSILEKG